MTTVRVLSAVSLGDEAVIASVELDGALIVDRVRVEPSPYSGRLIAKPPRRPNGSPLLAWSESVASEVAAAILADMPAGTVAVLSDPLPFTDPEADVHECPIDPSHDWLRCSCDPASALAAWEARGDAA